MNLRWDAGWNLRDEGLNFTKRAKRETSAIPGGLGGQKIKPQRRKIRKGRTLATLAALAVKKSNRKDAKYAKRETSAIPGGLGGQKIKPQRRKTRKGKTLATLAVRKQTIN